MKKLLWIIYLSPLSLFANELIIEAAYTSWEPYTYTVDGQPKGFELDIFEYVAESMGYKVIFTEMPWKRCLLNLKSGNVDVVISMLKNKEREAYAIFPSEHISTTDFMLVSLEERAIEFNRPLINLKEYKIGTILGFHYGDEFDNASYLDKVEVGSSDLLLELLLKKRLDLAVGNRTVFTNSFYKRDNAEVLVFHEPPIKSDKLYVGFSRKNSLDELANEFSSVLKLFKNSDQYQQILNRYYIK